MRSINPEPGARPLLATARPPESAPKDQLDLLGNPNDPAEVAVAGERQGPELSGVSTLNPGQNRTVSAVKGPGLSGVSAVNPGQNRTVCSETPPQTPPPNARAGREPQNPRLRKGPPNPPEGGSHRLGSIVEDFVTPRGRQRHRTVAVDLDEIRSQLLSPGSTDHAQWQQIRADRECVVGASMFEIWLAALDLVGCDDGGGLLLACPTATRQRVAGRYASMIGRFGRSHGRSARLATARERQLLDALAAASAKKPGEAPLPQTHQEAV